jgi:acyl carrier protein
MNNFIEKFKNQFIDADEISIEEDTKFRNIDSYDSLTGMAIILMIEDEYGVRIEDDVYKKLDTPQEIFDYINKNK